MKTYCKNVDILDVNFIEACIHECLDGKWNRNDVISFLSKYSGIDKSTIRHTIRDGRKHELFDIINDIARDMQEHLSNQTVHLPEIHYRERYDANSKKLRIIGVQSIIHQCYEYVAVNATKELFYKKFGVYQCASIPGRGQSYGKKAIEKWMKYDVKGTRYAAKMDVKKCYPSINQSKIKALLHRDLHKNPALLYLLDTLIDMYDAGLSIGSHLSQWLCNYYLSYAYHYISERLFTTRKSKQSHNTISVRLIAHVIFYMDDIILFGGNKKYLMQAVQMTNQYFAEVLGLTIKPDWRLFKVQYMDKHGKLHGSFVDMMGFRFYRGKTSIRQSIFRKMKRKYIKLRKLINKCKYISKRMAQSVMSYWGWVKNTNSYKFSKCYNVKYIIEKARALVSYFTKLSISAKKTLRYKKRNTRRKWRRSHVKVL